MANTAVVGITGPHGFKADETVINIALSQVARNGSVEPWISHIPPEWPAKALVWMASSDADTYLGEVISLRDPDIRKKVGLA